MLGEVPSGWRVALYADVAAINSETLPGSTSSDLTIRYFDISSVPLPGILGEPTVTTFGHAPSRARRRLRSGDTLVSCVRPYLRSFAFMRECEANDIASTGFAVLTPRIGVDPAFLYHTVWREEFLSFLRDRMTGSNYPAVNASDVAEAPLLLPPLPEQKKIAAILSSVDEAIQATQAVIDQTRRVKEGLLQDLLTRGIGHSRFKQTEIGEIPEGWEVALLDAVTERGSGHTPSKQHPEYWNGTIRWVSLADGHRLDDVYITTTESCITPAGIANSSAVLHPAGTVIVSRDASVGRSAIAACDLAVSQHFIAWRCSEKLNNLFLYYFLQRHKPQFEQIAVGSTIKTIGLGYFKKLKVPLPSIQEQQAIAMRLLSTDEALWSHAKHRAALVSARSGLLTDLLTGKVRVTP